MPERFPQTGPRRAALLTGAAGGIGTELARRLSAQGYRIIGVDRRVEAVKALAGLPAVEAVGCDLGDAAAVAALTCRIEDEWADDLELLVCNAGINLPGAAIDVPLNLVDQQLMVMLTGPIHLLATAARIFAERGRGHLLATVSLGGIAALPGSAAYSAAKAGLRAYLCALSNELRGSGVAVSGVYPGSTDTPMLMYEALHGAGPLNFVGKFATAGQVADGFERALRTRRLEIYVPYQDSILSRTVEAFPWLIPPLLPVLNHLGRKGRDRYLRQRGVTTPGAVDHEPRSNDF
ncbi:Short-chain dehydrogenase [Actinomadura madurae]|uniref:Short-chain dehydrogenase n=1 Tax=Actinomadura madurae TaxID=1993 RepID=A0A1I5I519_9ACTN|nr:SDR family oxidoreductase [Actinomadura madurae]SFO55653.1 Short-chain dehydrogenase [Actinomadura madurae]